MSVLEFISSLKWPATIFILASLAWWRMRRNPGLGEALKALIQARNVRLNLGGQELELTVTDAAATATSTDEQLEQAAAETHSTADIARIRREAVEEIMVKAAHWGWNMGQLGFQNPPTPVIEWNDEGHPEIAFGSAAIDPPRQGAIERRLLARRAMNTLLRHPEIIEASLQQSRRQQPPPEA